MTFTETYQKYLTDLRPIYGADEAAAITNFVFKHFTGKTRAELLAGQQQTPSSETAKSLARSLDQLKAKVPVQYVCGETEFFRLPFKVTPAVLIPRPETEELVAHALDWLKTRRNGSLLDVGTGSGCIAIPLKKNFPGLTATAIDKSGDALDVARENSKMNQVDINLIRLDFLQETGWPTLGTFDVIISNPPYIPFSEKQSLDENVVKHEPQMALFVPDDRPLIFYEAILRFSKDHLNRNGKIFMETHELLAKDVQRLFAAGGFDAEIKTDISGNERMVIATHSR